MPLSSHSLVVRFCFRSISDPEVASLYQLHAPEKQAVGLPIKIRWQAPAGHSTTDWIGLYRYEPDMSRQITSISSHGRWQFVGEGTLNGTMGEMVFSGDQLFWEAGLFELRYHCDGIHKVVSISKPITLYCLLMLSCWTLRLLTIAMLDAFLPQTIFTFPIDNELFLTDGKKVVLAICSAAFEKSDMTEQFTFDDSEEVQHKRNRVLTMIQQIFGVEFVDNILTIFPSPLALSDKVRLIVCLVFSADFAF